MKTKRNRPSYAAVLAASDAALLAAYKRDRLSDAKRAASAAYNAAADAAADAYDVARDTAEAYHA